jgi:DNA-binding NarL/FixJ family response regulator
VIKVMIVDDHQFVRQCLSELLEQTPDICVVAECADGREVVEAALRTDPDVVLMDLAMPGMTGLEATRLLLATRPDVRVVILTGTVTSASVRGARELGVYGYLVKGEETHALPGWVRAVADGDSVWAHAANAHLANATTSSARAGP